MRGGLQEPLQVGALAETPQDIGGDDPELARPLARYDKGAHRLSL